MNKKKKIISLLTAIPFAASTVALAISCGNTGNSDEDNKFTLDQGTEQSRIENADLGANPTATGRFDQTNDSKVRLAVTFSRGGDQWNGLKDIVNAYNASQAKTEGYLPVDLINVGSGYGGGADTVSSSLSSQNKDNFFNLILNYGTVAAQLAKYDMLLSFNSLNKNENTDITNFSSAFTTNNQTIENVENNSTYLLPFAKSTNVSYYDGIVMFYIINTFNEHKALDLNDPATKTWYDTLKAIHGNGDGIATTGENENDLGYVSTLWGAPVATASTVLDSYIKKPLKLSDLENYVGLLNFAQVAQKLFTNSAKDNSTLHILGIDDPTFALEMAVFQQNNGDYKTSLEAPQTTGSGALTVNYNGLNKNGSAIQKAARTAFNAFYDAYKSNSLVLQDPGAYTSTDLVYHKYAFAIGSTAGYIHDFIKDTANKYSYDAPETLSTFSFSATFDSATKLSQPNYVYFNISPLKSASKDGKKPADDPKQIAIRFGSYANPIYTHSNNLEQDKLDSHGLVISSDEDTTLFKQVITDNTTALNAGEAALVILPQKGNNASQLQSMVSKVKEYTTSNTDFVYAGQLTSVKSGSNYVAFVVKGLTDPSSYKSNKYPNGVSVQSKLSVFWSSIGGKVVATTGTNSLGKDELQIMYAPTTWDGNGNVNYGYLQGPSIIGIHANPKGDAATKLFVKWLVTNQGNIANPSFDTTKPEDDKKNPKYLLNGLSPLRYVEVNMSYISPVAGFEEKGNPNYLDPQSLNEGKNANPMLTLSAQMFEEAALSVKDKDNSTGKVWKLYESPSSMKSNSFRTAVDAAFKSMQKTNYSFDTFAKSVQSSFSGSTSQK